jgi:AAA domain
MAWHHQRLSESDLQLTSSEERSTRVIRIATEQTLTRRRPAAILLDDAQHFGITSSGHRLINQLNVLKSLADKSGITHVLCGTYELIPLRNLNGQLSRRSIDIHFGRYHAEQESHRQQFINVLYTFQERLPLVETPDLVSKWDYLYERSLGCVGVLKDWLTRSLALALKDDSPTLKFKYLERRALSIKKCTTMLREAKLGESEFEESEALRALLRKDLGLETEPLKAAQGNTNAPVGFEPPSNSHNNRRPRVGRRNPVRDKVGVKTT